VAAGDAVLAPEVTRRVVDTFRAAPRPDAARYPDPGVPDFDALTDRERDVLRCLGDGLSNGEIGKQLYITEATVKTHVSRVLAKLGLSSRVQAAILVREHPL
ncbi:MAG: response regulator transcription factor, partial [Gordonia amarae]